MDINEIRESINRIDAEMAALFAERMEEVKKIAEYKSERGLEIEDLERERRVIQNNGALIEDEAVRSVYIPFMQSVMDVSKHWQHILLEGLNVACAVREGAGWEEAASLIFPDANIDLLESFESAYKATESGECDVTVLPLENSDGGEFGRVYDLIFNGPLYMNNVYSVEREGSITRYAVLTRTENLPKVSRKSDALLVMFTVSDEPGGLAKAINIISAYGYNMRVLRSRPLRDLPWHYYFYAELEGDCSAEGASRIVKALEATCPAAKIKGCFKEDGDISGGGMLK